MLCCGNTSEMRTRIISHYYWVEIHPLLCMRLRNLDVHWAEQGNLAHTWIMVLMKLKLRTFWLLVGKTTIETCSFRFLKRNQSEFESHHHHIVGKKSTVKDLNKTVIKKIFPKKATTLVIFWNFAMFFSAGAICEK